MESANLALSAEEKMNLMQNNEANTRDSAFNVGNVNLYSLEDLFNLNQEDIDNNVYQVIEVVETQNKQVFKYLQVRKELVETGFSKHEVL